MYTVYYRHSADQYTHELRGFLTEEEAREFCNREMAGIIVRVNERTTGEQWGTNGIYTVTFGEKWPFTISYTIVREPDNRLLQVIAAKDNTRFFFRLLLNGDWSEHAVNLFNASGDLAGIKNNLTDGKYYPVRL